ncbi:beta-phosphoglucomutase [Schinkia azotoformans]|nr:beta-phosphoglucomutase [Schinkia azotoformans]MEC1743590.1 beta-phosphoglucomutase [Schinkia azotoformans]MEC1748233.1 beta-phosphoglucomutase [Schinkia azotoformans]MEC1759491.1 beta-phosphoglucomutase [Schinkia azotoformans]MEC1768537.1 beta-phosphoglucomutase [Schinkia azotoformans]
MFIKKQLQAIIFDLDGVITNTAEFHYQAWKQLADKLNIPFNREFNEELKGISRMESLEKILIHGNRQNDFSDSEKMMLAAEKNQQYIKLIERLTPADILPGIKQLIKDCKKKKIMLALASASKNARTVIKALGLDNVFDVIVDAKTIQNGKPDPEIFLTAANLLNVEVSSCIGIEDAAAGVEAIKAAGMYAVGVGKKETFEKADYVVEKNDELVFEEIIKHYYANA